MCNVEQGMYASVLYQTVFLFPLLTEARSGSLGQLTHQLDDY